MNKINGTILVTGACGMIGSATVCGLLDAGYRVIGVDVKDSSEASNEYIHYTVDLSNNEQIEKIFEENKIDRVIHLAALAHSVDGKKYTWEDYYHLNVSCSKNIFNIVNSIPLLFISTVDVYGFAEGTVDISTEVAPVSHYAKSKVLAEQECRKLVNYAIYRLSPVYTDTVKRDIQKRYYLKYPNIAYQIGAGKEYEILNIKEAVSAFVKWCDNGSINEIRILKDPKCMNTSDCIAEEKKAGRANIVLRFPNWMVKFGYTVLKALTGKNKYTFLLHKAVYPLRTE